MAAFIFRRFGSMLLVLFCVVTITFFMIRLAAGQPVRPRTQNDPRHRKSPQAQVQTRRPRRPRRRANPSRAVLGLGTGGKAALGEAGSLLQQYADYLRRLVSTATFGLSTKYLNRSVNEILAQTLPVSLFLGALAFLIATIAGVWLGTFAAVRHNSLFDVGAMFAALLAISRADVRHGAAVRADFCAGPGHPAGRRLGIGGERDPARAGAGRAVCRLHRAADALEHAGSARAGFRPHGPRKGLAGAPRRLQARAQGRASCRWSVTSGRWRRIC